MSPPATTPGRGRRTREVVQAVRARIAARTLAPGERLPSVRSFATSQGVSPSTVVEAYDRLVAEGLIRARPGAGFYVADSARPPLVLAPDPTPQARAVDPLWVSRQSLDTDAATLRPGCGWLPPAWLPTDALRRALRAAARAEDGLLVDYAASAGLHRLRRQLAARCAGEGLAVGPEQVLLTVSGNQAVDLVIRLLLRPGDAVLVDDPCYFNFRALLRAHAVRVVGVPYTPNGPDVAAFERLLAAERPRLYITNTALHNPTGATLAPATAQRLVAAAAAHDLVIVEDDIFADFEPTPSVRLAVLDGLQRVIRVGSFSKTLSAALRCGYVVARPEWIEALTDLQIATNFGGPGALTATLLADVLAEGAYRRHLEGLRRRLAGARRDAATAMRRLGVEPWLMPRGGFYLWARLPEGRSATAVAQAALAHHLVLAPGNVFSASQTADGFMRFNVAQCLDPQVWAGLARVLA